MRYTVSSTVVENLTGEQIQAEASELRYQIKAIEGDMATRKAWAQAEGREGEKDFSSWLARARGFHTRLMKRYLLIRVREKLINRETRNSGRRVRRSHFDELREAVEKLQKGTNADS